MSVSISKEKCIRCGACMDECPEGAICYGENNMPYVIEGDCNECGVCCSVCCSEALSL
jgi:MinD superfamily P-loop ATPase